MAQYALYENETGLVRQFIDTNRWNYNSEVLSSPNLLSINLIDTEFDLYSTQTWYVINGELTQTLPLTTTNNTLVSNKISSLNSQCQTNIFNGFTYPEPINGNTYIFTLSMTDQTNGLAAFSSAQGVIQNAKSWTASTNMIAFSSVIEVNGLYYVAYTSGTTGSTEPTFTSEFSTPVTDGTVTWYQYGILLGTTVGNVFFTAPQVISLFVYSVSYINGQRSAYTKAKNLLNQIANATSETVSTAYSLNSYILDDLNNLYQCTTAGTSGSTLPTYNTTVGKTTTDGTVVWTCLGSFTSYVNNISL